MTQYQGLLCENPRVRLETVQTLNSATFLPNEDCEEIIDDVYSSRPDLTAAPHLSDSEIKLFMDGSSFVWGRWQKARFAVTIANDIVQAEAPLHGCSAQ
jgi:hypothetical protein